MKEKKDKKTIKEWFAGATTKTKEFINENAYWLIPVCEYTVAGIVGICLVKGFINHENREAAEALAKWKEDPIYQDAITGQIVHATRELTQEEVKQAWYEVNNSPKTLEQIFDEMGVLKKD